MKRFVRMLVAGLAVATVAASATACGAADDKNAAGAQKQYVAMSFGGGDVTIWNDAIKLMKPKVEAAGLGFLSDDPQFKAEKQVSDWQAWVQRGDVKAIMGWPVQADALVPVTKDAEAKGVKIISYATGWTGARPGLTVDNYGAAVTLGQETGQWVTDKRGGTATVIVMTDRSTELGVDRAKGMLDGLKKTAPNAKVVEMAAGTTLQDGYAKSKTQLSATPDATVWIAGTADTIVGAHRALMDKGVKKDDPKYFLGSLDGTPESLEKIAVPNSILRLGYIVTAAEIADINASLLIAAAKGEEIKPKDVKFARVTAENVADYRG